MIINQVSKTSYNENQESIYKLKDKKTFKNLEAKAILEKNSIKYILKHFNGSF